MGQTPETTRVHLQKNRQGVATCVYCSTKCTINMSSYTDCSLEKKSLKVECSTCKKVFQIKLERRRYHRIHTNIPGKIFHAATEEKKYDINIRSLSVGGIGFIVNKNFDIKAGDIYIVKCQLNDRYASVICEEIAIKRVAGHFVDTEFYHRDKYNYELDFYIAVAL